MTLPRFAARFFAASFFAAIALAIAFSGPVRAQTSELQAFHQATAEAFGPYRTARAYLRTENFDAAAFELEGMLEAWAALEARFGANPPDAFAADPSYAAVLERIGQDAAAALSAIDSSDPETARELLKPLHAAMSDLRRRNGLYLLADCLREFSAAMDVLWVYRHAMPDLTQIESQVEIVSRAAIVEYEANRCEAMASRGLRQDPEFRRLFDIFYEGMSPLRRGVLEQSPARIINVLRELRSAQYLIFFRFG